MISELCHKYECVLYIHMVIDCQKHVIFFQICHKYECLLYILILTFRHTYSSQATDIRDISQILPHIYRKYECIGLLYILTITKCQMYVICFKYVTNMNVYNHATNMSVCDMFQICHKYECVYLCHKYECMLSTPMLTKCQIHVITLKYAINVNVYSYDTNYMSVYCPHPC